MIILAFECTMHLFAEAFQKTLLVLDSDGFQAAGGRQCPRPSLDTEEVWRCVGAAWHPAA